MSVYVVLIKENKEFKFITYCGEFIDFVREFEHRIYFKLRIPSIMILNKKLKISWYKRFCEDFYFLNSSGVSIVDSIEILKNNAETTKDKKMISLFRTVNEKLMKGHSLYTSIKSTQYKFDNMFLSMIKISEETGSLNTILKNLSEYYEEKILINNKVKSSLLYPSLLFGVMVVLVNLCILYFIPSYVDSFQTQFSSLPSYSRTFINICIFIKNNYILFLFITFLSMFIFIKSKKIKNIFRKILLNISFFQKLYFKNCQIKFVQALYYMINSGIDLSSSLKIMSEMKNELYWVYANYVYSQINQGFDFYEALNNTKIFEQEIISIIRVGEKSSNLAKSLKNIWISYSKKYYQNLEKYTKLIEPIFILICGLVVVVFISLFILPLISYDNFSHIWEGI